MEHQTSLTVCVKHWVINQRVPVFGPGWNKAENVRQLLSFKIQKNKTHNPHAPFNLNIEVLLNTHLSYAQTTGSEKEESGEET